MAKKKIKLTRPELKKQRDTMTRFQRFLPMLKLKQQQLQLTMRQITKQREQALKDIAKAQDKFDRYVAVFGDISGVNVPEMANEPIHFDFDKYDQAVFNSLSDGIQGIVKKSPEWQAINAPDSGFREEGPDEGDRFMDDDIPF